MSHVFERVCGQAVPIAVGAAIAYARGPRHIGLDMSATQPTIMMTVPRFLESTKDRIIDNAEKSPWLDRRLFQLAMKQSLKRVRGRYAFGYLALDLLVLANIRDRVGGRLRYFVSGGAALPMSTWEFYKALGMTVLQGYGLSETAGGTFVNHPKRNRPETVGESLGMEVRIADDGEILLRGPGLMQGYHKRPSETAAAIDADGWFHTGDIGTFDGTHLRITDRKKDVLVLGNGKNVAPQPIENLLISSPLIAQAAVFGDGQKHTVALILPNREELARRLDAAAAKDAAASPPTAYDLMRREINRLNENLADFERVGRFVLIDQPFSIENGQLTPTMKIRRKIVYGQYRGQIEGEPT
jgi:long-chain acyl-CoA synthetase